jgi:hypothetical protein
LEISLKIIRWAIAIISTIFLIPAAHAEKYALLVGINDYTRITQLKGPENDVDSIAALLVKNLGYRKANIKKLKSSDATQSNILVELKKLKEKLKNGDEFVFLFSGHGTSFFDSDAASSEMTQFKKKLHKRTGALAPYDARVNGTTSEISNSLIIGRRDLRPIFIQIDKKQVKGLVIIDACYSQFSSRILGMSSERIATTSILKEVDASQTDLRGKIKTRKRSRFQRFKSDSYPYRNIITIAASKYNQTAEDISRLDRFSYDKKAHGALSNVLIELMDQKTGDLNGDGNITYDELDTVIQNKMELHKRSHRAMISPQSMEDKSRLRQNVFMRGKNNASDNYQKYESLSIYIDPSLPNIKRWIANNKQFKLVSKNATLNVTPHGYNNYRVETTSKELITIADSLDELKSILSHQIWIEKLLTKVQYGQPFTLNLEFLDKTRNGEFYCGDDFNLVATTSRRSIIVILGVFPNGDISVIYPSKAAQYSRLNNNINIPVTIAGKVGRDAIVAVAFNEYDKPIFYSNLLKYRTVEPGKYSDHKSLVDWLTQGRKNRAIDILTLNSATEDGRSQCES